MKRKNMKTLVTIALVLLAIVSTDIIAETNTALLIKQTPENGGTITPSLGVTNYSLNQTVTVSAIPRPGYQFVYWIGDVSDATATSTITYLDSPKVIIAVFERVKYDNLSPFAGPTSAPNENLRPSGHEYPSYSNSPVAGKRPHKYYGPD